MLENSVIVVAHPDDEVLWFSSILEKVTKIIICFVNSKDYPHLGPARDASLKVYPLNGMVCLGLDESDTFNGANWENPVLSDFGINLPNRSTNEPKYRSNFHELRQRLRGILENCDNVFTHNPWGEYGHEEHIQVYSAVKSLQHELGFKQWFSNYCSNRSFKLMLQSVSCYRDDYMTFETNKSLATELINIYKEKGCWTWFEDWKPFKDESFLDNQDLKTGDTKHGHLFPLNMFKFRYEIKQEKKQWWKRLTIT